MHILLHLGGNTPGSGSPALRSRWRGHARGQNDIVILEAGVDGLSFQLRCVKRIDAYIGIVQCLLRAKKRPLEMRAAFVGAHRLTGPVGKNVVARNPNQALAPWSSSEMTRDKDKGGQCSCTGITSEVP